MAAEDEIEEEDIIYISPDAPDINCAKVIYEVIVLAIPLLKTCDKVDDKECNPEVIDHFYSAPETEEEEITPFSEALKNLKLK